MATSQNGWPANDRSLIGTYTVPGTATRIAMRMGDVSVVLLGWLAWFAANIEPLDGGVLDDWGYAEREVRGGTDLSNHASGTAVDQNATRHPLGVAGTFTADQQRRMNDRLGFYDGVLRLGMNYTGRKDDMHVEINAGSAAVAVVANKIREGDELSAQFEKDMTEWTRMRDARDQALEKDLRGDLAVKAKQIEALQSDVAKILAAVAAPA